MKLKTFGINGNWLCAVTFVALGVCLVPFANAQTVIAVPFNTAAFQWSVPTPDATHTEPTSHLITCGASALSVPMPTTTALISAVVPAPGAYTCTVAAVNSLGSSAAIAFPEFEAGFPPLAPTNPQIVVP